MLFVQVNLIAVKPLKIAKNIAYKTDLIISVYVQAVIQAISMIQKLMSVIKVAITLLHIVSNVTQLMVRLVKNVG